MPSIINFLRLLKNAQTQVELCEIPLAGAPKILERRTWMYAQACPVLDTGKDEGNAADGLFSAACNVLP